MNSPIANDGSFDFVTEIGEVDTLETERGKGHNIGEKEEEKGVDDSEEAQTKSDELDQAARANVVASGEENRKLLTELETLRAQMAEVKGLHKMQKQHEAQMLLRMDKLGAAFLVLTPQNRWDIAACAKDLTLVGRKRLIAKRCDGNSEMFWKRANSGSRSVFAEMPIPKKDIGIFYFELKIGTEDVKMTSLYFGLATKQMSLNSTVGTEKGTYAYGDLVYFLCQGVETYAHKAFDVGDIVGCGVNLATRRIIYTLNGERLDTADLCVDSADDLSDLFPCVTLFSPGDKIEANFGPIFTFDIVDGI